MHVPPQKKETILAIFIHFFSEWREASRLEEFIEISKHCRAGKSCCWWCRTWWRRCSWRWGPLPPRRGPGSPRAAPSEGWPVLACHLWIKTLHCPKGECEACTSIHIVNSWHVLAFQQIDRCCLDNYIFLINIYKNYSQCNPCLPYSKNILLWVLYKLFSSEKSNYCVLENIS